LKTTATDTRQYSANAKSAFEDLYLTVRDKEGRLYNDEEVALLPDIDSGHPYYQEWQMRKRSSSRLLAYLQKKNKPLIILEIGCGNGWLSAKLAGLKDASVTGIDANQPEIEQARRVFNNPAVNFIYGNFNAETFGEHLRFDVIVFAASFQYFASAKVILQEAMQLLNLEGEIHIMDTHFYTAEAAKASAGRSRNYYADMGVAEMASHYFHHSLAGLEGFDHKILFNPDNMINRITKKDVFYWVMIK
jgi:2-polyprenyl-3-methyl-5-hydroxy-6-metoxy-1,4-benzoquinol methylase